MLSCSSYKKLHNYDNCFQVEEFAFGKVKSYSPAVKEMGKREPSAMLSV